jgi:hypothetical protein
MAWYLKRGSFPGKHGDSVIEQAKRVSLFTLTSSAVAISLGSSLNKPKTMKDSLQTAIIMSCVIHHQ